MEKCQRFKFQQARTSLGQVEGIRFQGGAFDQTTEHGKPVHIFHIKGLQIIGVPPELMRNLSVQDILKTNRVSTTTVAHFETAQRFYLRQVVSKCLMALPRSGGMS